MKKNIFNYFIISTFFSCKTTQLSKPHIATDKNLTIAFGSCNKQYEENELWDDVLKYNPKVWVWGGDNIYSDTDDMEVMRKDYEAQKQQEGYSDIVKSMDVIGTWDDHDYGLNDGGMEHGQKREAQQLFLDFMNVDENSWRREQEGVYHSKIYSNDTGSVKVMVLDTRYFRTALTKDFGSSKRFLPNVYGEGTILGEGQWGWLENELKSSKADFNVIVSSIQVLSNKHGFETWGNFPHEVDKLLRLIKESKAKGVIILSGDRHISEFSQINVDGMKTPVIDFTSSGLTHTYEAFGGEENPYRIGGVVKDKSFGVLKFNFEKKSVIMQMIGNNNEVLQQINQAY